MGWGAIGSALGSITGGILDRQIQKKDAKRAWEKQTAYEHPLAQMQRFEEAGLNPRLIYENVSGPSANYQAISPSFDNVTKNAKDLRMAQETISGMEQQRNTSYAQEQNLVAQNANIQWQNHRLKALLPYEIEQAKSNIGLTRANIYQNSALPVHKLLDSIFQRIDEADKKNAKEKGLKTQW